MATRQDPPDFKNDPELARLMAEAETVSLSDVQAWFANPDEKRKPAAVPKRSARPGWIDRSFGAPSLPGAKHVGGGGDGMCHRGKTAVAVKIYYTESGVYAICLHETRHVVRIGDVR